MFFWPNELLRDLYYGCKWQVVASWGGSQHLKRETMSQWKNKSNSHSGLLPHFQECNQGMQSLNHIHRQPVGLSNYVQLYLQKGWVTWKGPSIFSYTNGTASAFVRPMKVSNNCILSLLMNVHTCIWICPFLYNRNAVHQWNTERS